jgi:hypothetical protein
MPTRKGQPPPEFRIQERGAGQRIDQLGRASTLSAHLRGSGFDPRRLDGIFLGHEPEVSGGSQIHAAARQLLAAIGLHPQISGGKLLHRFQYHATSPIVQEHFASKAALQKPLKDIR